MKDLLDHTSDHLREATIKQRLWTLWKVYLVVSSFVIALIIGMSGHQESPTPTSLTGSNNHTLIRGVGGSSNRVNAILSETPDPDNGPYEDEHIMPMYGLEMQVSPGPEVGEKSELSINVMATDSTTAGTNELVVRLPNDLTVSNGPPDFDIVSSPYEEPERTQNLVWQADLTEGVTETFTFDLVPTSVTASEFHDQINLFVHRADLSVSMYDGGETDLYIKVGDSTHQGSVQIEWPDGYALVSSDFGEDGGLGGDGLLHFSDGSTTSAPDISRADFEEAQPLSIGMDFDYPPTAGLTTTVSLIVHNTIATSIHFTGTITFPPEWSLVDGDTSIDSTLQSDETTVWAYQVVPSIVKCDWDTTVYLKIPDTLVAQGFDDYLFRQYGGLYPCEGEQDWQTTPPASPGGLLQATSAELRTQGQWIAQKASVIDSTNSLNEYPNAEQPRAYIGRAYRIPVLPGEPGEGEATPTEGAGGNSTATPRTPSPTPFPSLTSSPTPTATPTEIPALCRPCTRQSLCPVPDKNEDTLFVTANLKALTGFPASWLSRLRVRVMGGFIQPKINNYPSRPRYVGEELALTQAYDCYGYIGVCVPRRKSIFLEINATDSLTCGVDEPIATKFHDWAAMTKLPWSEHVYVSWTPPKAVPSGDQCPFELSFGEQVVETFYPSKNNLTHAKGQFLASLGAYDIRDQVKQGWVWGVDIQGNDAFNLPIKFPRTLSLPCLDHPCYWRPNVYIPEAGGDSSSLLAHEYGHRFHDAIGGLSYTFYPVERPLIEGFAQLFMYTFEDYQGNRGKLWRNPDDTVSFAESHVGTSPLDGYGSVSWFLWDVEDVPGDPAAPAWVCNSDYIDQSRCAFKCIAQTMTTHQNLSDWISGWASGLGGHALDNFRLMAVYHSVDNTCYAPSGTGTPTTPASATPIPTKTPQMTATPPALTPTLTPTP